MNTVYEKLMCCYESMRCQTSFCPEAALVLGSGLGNYADQMDIVQTVDYKDIDGFPISTVAGHAGRFILGFAGRVPVIAMQGRVHYYEGYAMSDVVTGVRLMKLMGAKTLILTNAAGGVNFDFAPGDLMMITDHISTMIPSPLIGANIDALGTRFPDMSHVYDPKLQSMILKCAEKLEIPVRQGVYMQLTGPQYETPAEIRMARLLGADAVGMSTVCEAIAANHMGMHICGISCITNMASGMTKKPLGHEEVQQTADRAAKNFARLITEIIKTIGEENR